jgi:hypothetical protein
MKTVLVSAVICITGSCYMVQFFSSLCFVGHELTDSVAENLDGNVANLFLPLGWAAIGLFVASIVFMQIFVRWGNVSCRSSSLFLACIIIPNSILSCREKPKAWRALTMLHQSLTAQILLEFISILIGINTYRSLVTHVQ